jgi:hypothetical protein
MSRYTSTRTALFPSGLPGIIPDFAILGNILLSRTVLLVRIGIYKNCQWLLEQPSSTFVPRMPRFQDLILSNSVAISAVHSQLKLWLGDAYDISLFDVTHMRQ